MLYLGIDQHQRQITVSVRDEGGTVIQRRQVSTRPEKVRAFLDAVRRQSGDEGFMAILEVCGFNDWLIALLEEYGCREIVLIHPGKRSKRKTDRRDANKLSELLWLNRGRLRRGGRLTDRVDRAVCQSAEPGELFRPDARLLELRHGDRPARLLPSVAARRVHRRGTERGRAASHAASLPPAAHRAVGSTASASLGGWLL